MPEKMSKCGNKVPLIEQLCKSRTLTDAAILSGMLPCKSVFEPICIYSRTASDHKPDGIVPSRRLVCRLSAERAVKYASCDGMVPSNEFDNNDSAVTKPVESQVTPTQSQYQSPADRLLESQLQLFV